MMNNIVEQWNPINEMVNHDESGVDEGGST